MFFLQNLAHKELTAEIKKENTYHRRGNIDQMNDKFSGSFSDEIFLISR